MSSRILTAIVFADISGYSAIMQKNETIALNIRNRFKTILEENAGGYDGKIVHFYGDGALLIFASGLKAAEFAIKLQQSASEEPKIPLKTAIHMGDVVHDSEGVFGDGVNITSRIESVAHPGSVLISDKLRDIISNQPHILTKSLGKISFKNIENEIEIFAIINEGLVNPDSISHDGKLSQKIYERPKKKMSKYFYGAAVLIIITVIIFLIIHFSKEIDLQVQEIHYKKEEVRKYADDYLIHLYNPGTSDKLPNISLADNFTIKGASGKYNPFSSEYNDTSKNKKNILRFSGILIDELFDKNYNCKFSLVSMTDSILVTFNSQVLDSASRIKILSIEYTNIIPLKSKEAENLTDRKTESINDKPNLPEKEKPDRLTIEERQKIKRNIKRKLLNKQQ